MGVGIVDIAQIHETSIIDRTRGIRQVLALLKTQNLPFETYSCLDLFAGDGSFCTSVLAQSVDKIECIEHDPDIFRNLKRNLPQAKCHCADAIEWVQNNRREHDLIHIDNPQNVYGEYCEYFNLMSLLTQLFQKQTIIIHNLNVAPYKYDKSSIWARRRNEFYNTQDASILDLESVKKHHVQLFSQQGIKVSWIEAVPRENHNASTYLYYLVYQLNK